MFKFINHYFAIRKAKKRVVLLGQMIDAIDRGFEKNTIPRWKRRQFWHDFITNPESRKKFIQDMGIRFHDKK